MEYGDYQCPYCGQAEVVIRELLDSFGDDLRYVWRHLPLNDVHPQAQMAAEAAEAAASQGAFWEMHDRLLANQDALQPPDLERYAAEIGLDIERFWDELTRREHAARVADDVAERRRERRGRHAHLLHQREAPPGRLRRPDPDPRGERGAGAGRGRRRGCAALALVPCVLRPLETRGGALGAALELPQLAVADRPPAVELGAIEVEPLALVARLLAQGVQLVPASRAGSGSGRRPATLRSKSPTALAVAASTPPWRA